MVLKALPICPLPLFNFKIRPINLLIDCITHRAIDVKFSQIDSKEVVLELRVDKKAKKFTSGRFY